MRHVSIVDAKAHFSALLAAVEAGEELAITKRGRVIARLVPDAPRRAADAFRTVWESGGLEIDAPPDVAPAPVPTWDAD
jgi:prevent-host-death family protein